MYINNCPQTNCPFYFKSEGCVHPSAPTPVDCDILPALPAVEEIPLDPPMYVRFSYRDEWRHIPANEVFPVWTEMDFGFAAYTFREIHGSNGALTVFSTTDFMAMRLCLAENSRLCLKSHDGCYLPAAGFKDSRGFPTIL